MAVEPRAGLSPERIDARATAEQLHYTAKVSAGVKVKVHRYPEGDAERSQDPTKRWVDQRPQ